MPPRITVTKEEILKKALSLVRREGAEALNARALANEIGCSTQPLFSNFESMEALKKSVIDRAYALYGEFLIREMQREDEPKYKLSGLGYIRFASEEKELFKMLFMRDRSNEEKTVAQDIGAETGISVLCEKMGFTRADAEKFHTAMWMFVHGIASMIATDFLIWDAETISEYLSKAYSGFLISFSKEGKK